jgi:Spy/CpxP family protein refolding chaperone
MKRTALLLSVIALSFALFTGEAAAGPGNGPGGKGPDTSAAVQRMHRMFDDLKLTDEQQARLKALRDEMMTIRKQHIEAVKGVRDKMKAELLKPSPSQKMLDRYAGELGELHKKMTKDRTDHLLKVKKVLTPEQFSKLVEKEERTDRGFGGGMRSGKHPHPGDCPPKGDCPRHGNGGGPKGCCPRSSGTDSTAATR